MGIIKNKKGFQINYNYLHENDIRKLSNEYLRLAAKYLTSDTGVKQTIINPLSITQETLRLNQQDADNDIQWKKDQLQHLKNIDGSLKKMTKPKNK